MHHFSMRARADGLSLVELVIAVALLGIISAAALQFLSMTESTMFGEQSRLTKQQKSEAVSAYIYKKFSTGQLADSPAERVYADTDMPSDLQSGPGVTLVTLFGNSSRFNGVDPRCTLVADASIATGTFKMQHSCMQQGGQSIVQQMNDLIAKGVVITTGLEEGVGRCSISRPITIDGATGIATISVDDPNCLAWGLDLTRGVLAGKQVLLPRLSADGTGVAIQGHQGRDGTWTALPATTAVCDASLDQSICGYYREFEEAGLPASVTLAKSFTMNMGRFREFCLAP